ncbi:hypothetical protein HD554DRAFT_2251943 [Boletus coccyginus]|nr:hypothetical protein HD554DRAFT_2251943 [Boletus coccyginus]
MGTMEDGLIELVHRGIVVDVGVGLLEVFRLARWTGGSVLYRPIHFPSRPAFACKIPSITTFIKNSPSTHTHPPRLRASSTNANGDWAGDGLKHYGLKAYNVNTRSSVRTTSIVHPPVFFFLDESDSEHTHRVAPESDMEIHDLTEIDHARARRGGNALPYDSWKTHPISVTFRQTFYLSVLGSFKTYYAVHNDSKAASAGGSAAEQLCVASLVGVVSAVDAVLVPIVFCHGQT